MSIISAIRTSRSPATAFVVIGLYWGTFAAYVPVLKDNVGASDGLFGWLLLSTSIGLLSAMWLAPRADRFLGARGMQAGTVFLALAYLLPGLMHTPLTFAISMALVGMASGLTDVLMNARVSDLEARHGKSLMNANHGVFSVGYMLAALATGVAREADLEPFIMFALVGCVAVFLSTQMRMQPSTGVESDEMSGGYPVLPILICGGIVLVAFMSEATVETWSALHIERTLAGGAAEGALGPATLGLTMAVGRLSGQMLTERFSETVVIVWAALIASVGALIAAGAPSPTVAYIGFGVLGLGVSVIGPIGLALVGQLVSSRYRTEAISRAAVIGFSGFFVAPVLMGTVSEFYGLRVAFACVAGFLLLALPMTALVKKL